MSFDGTAKDGADYITCNVLFCRRSTGEKRTLRLRGAILTDGKSVAQETAALKGDCVPGGGRPWRRACGAACPTTSARMRCTSPLELELIQPHTAQKPVLPHIQCAK